MTIGSLEKSPLLVPCQHVSSSTTPRAFLNFEQRQIVTQVMDKLIRIYSPNFLELFKVCSKSFDVIDFHPLFILINTIFQGL